MKSKLLKLLVLVAVVAAFFIAKSYGLTDYLTLDYLKSNLNEFKSYAENNLVLTVGVFMGVYILATALSLPGATILTLAGGAIFGFTKGLIVVSFASTIGATLAFLMARLFLRDYVQSKFGDKLKSFNDGVKRDGAFYLLTLRLIPIFPFFLINMVMGLTPIKTLTYFFTSQIGMLPGTAAYVYAGLSISQIDSLSGIVSPQMLLAFAGLGLVPLISKFVISFIRKQKVYKGFKKPKSFDYNLVAIGGGAAGLVTTYIGAAVKAKVALIEKHKMGGDCLNTGCVPSKAIIKSASIVHNVKKASEYGLKNINTEFEFSEVMERVQTVIKKIEPHDSIERYEGLGVECITGEAKILSPWEVEVNGKVLTTKNIVIATGARPFVPPIKGIENTKVLTSDNLWDIRELPKKFAVLGAGPIGLEMAQAFSRLGSEVTVIEMGGQIMTKEDDDVSDVVFDKLTKEGVNILLHTRAKEFQGQKLICETKGGDIEIDFDQILVAVGRAARTKGFGLEEIGVKLRPNGTIITDEFLRSNLPNVFACGDVAGNFQLTHTAAHEAWYASVNALFGRFKKFKRDYNVIPWATYTAPEVATVGQNEKALKEKGIDYEVYKYEIDDLDRAIADSNDYGFVKVMLKPGTDKILGATIVGSNASDLLMEFTSAMKNKFGLNAILGTIHPYPTMSEANKYLAGVWKQANKPEKLLKWVQKFHKWERS